MQHVVVDANVLVSFFHERNDQQHKIAKALLLAAEEGRLVAVVPQFVLFEVAYVLHSFYAAPPPQIAEVIRAMLTYPGVLLIEDCPWKLVLDHWPDPISAINDAAIVAVAISNKYDSIATFDQKLTKRMKALHVQHYP